MAGTVSRWRTGKAATERSPAAIASRIRGLESSAPSCSIQMGSRPAAALPAGSSPSFSTAVRVASTTAVRTIGSSAQIARQCSVGRVPSAPGTTTQYTASDQSSSVASARRISAIASSSEACSSRTREAVC